MGTDWRLRNRKGEERRGGTRRSLQDGSLRCLKVTEPEDDYLRNLAVREAHLLRDNQHPHIVRYFEHFSLGQRYFCCAMQLMSFDLATWIYNDGAPPGDRFVVGVLSDVSSALSFLHERHVAHRDVKPPNILTIAGDTWLLADFGCSLMREELFQRRLSSVAPQPLRGATYVGTPPYMAPELARLALYNSQSWQLPYDARAVDAWALGCTFVEMCSLRVFNPGGWYSYYI